jgi:hypothetical protein
MALSTERNTALLEQASRDLATGFLETLGYCTCPGQVRTVSRRIAPALEMLLPMLECRCEHCVLYISGALARYFVEDEKRISHGCHRPGASGRSDSGQDTRRVPSPN